MKATSVMSFLVLVSVFPTFVTQMVTKDNAVYATNLPISCAVAFGLTVLYWLWFVNRVQIQAPGSSDRVQIQAPGSSDKISRLVMELIVSTWIIFPSIMKPALTVTDWVTVLSATVLGHTIPSLFSCDWLYSCGEEHRNEDWLFLLRSISGDVTIYLILKGNRNGYAGMAIYLLLMGACVYCEKRRYNNAPQREPSVSGLNGFHKNGHLFSHLKKFTLDVRSARLFLSTSSFLVLASVLPTFVAEMVTKDDDIYARNPYLLPVSVSVGIGLTVLYFIKLLYFGIQVQKKALSSNEITYGSAVVDLIFSIWIIFPMMMKPDISIIDLITVLSATVLGRTIYSRNEDWLYMLRSIAGNVTIYLIIKGHVYCCAAIAINSSLILVGIIFEKHYNRSPLVPGT